MRLTEDQQTNKEGGEIEEVSKNGSRDKGHVLDERT